jgi:hypothetical protein
VFQSPDFKLIDDVYDRLGPTPRICIDKVDSEVVPYYEQEIRHALRDQSIEALRSLTTSAEGLTLDSSSHKLALLRRMNNDDLSTSNIHITPITDHIGSRLALQLRNADIEEQLGLYKTYATTPSFRGMTGTLFEGFCHGLFQIRICVKLHEMIRLGGGTPKRQPQWHTVYNVVDNEELEKKRQDALHRPILIDTRPSSTSEYHDHTLRGLQILENVYYIGLDSFLLINGYLYIFQMSGAKRHGINGGLLPLLDQCANIPPHDHWCFIFVIPDDVELLKTPYPQSSEERKLKLFSVRMTMEEAV